MYYADRLFDVTGRLADLFWLTIAIQRGSSIDLETLIAQRVLSLAAGYEDLNDHDRIA